MEKLIVKGGNRLVGAVKTSGAKNAVLPIIAASILGTTPSHLDEVPMLEDVHTISEVLKCLGLAVECSPEKNVLDIDSTEITSYEAPYELVRTMRASFLVMGPLLARIGKARISMPGGCAIGARPIDIHLKGFEALGVKIEQGHGYIEASAPEGLKGTSIYFDFPSVGATENIMMAASLAEGTTILENAAEEPEIVDLANYLNKMGAKIRGAGTDTIRIEGVDKLHGADYTIIPDRIEAGTYMIAAAMTGGDVVVENVLPEHQKPLIAKLREAGAVVEEDIDKVRSFAADYLSDEVKKAKNILKNALAPEIYYTLIRYERIGECGERLALLDKTGASIMLGDAPGKEKTTDMIRLLPDTSLLEDKVLSGGFFYDRTENRIKLMVLSILTDNEIVRIAY